MISLFEESTMIKRCTGCGAVLQQDDKEHIGYTKDLSLDQCERCFRIAHYGDYQVVTKDNADYLNILKTIQQTKDLVIFVVDLFNLNQEVYALAKQIHNPCLLVLTKRDLFASDIHDEKFTSYLANLPLNIIDQVLISSKNNTGYDELYEKIQRHQRSNHVYVVGLTNAGKSTMINQLFHHYSKRDCEITTSNLPSTTIDMLPLPFSETLTIIDTPGILDHSITGVIDANLLKRITPKKTIRPITYQIKVKQSIIIDKLLRIDVTPVNSVTCYFANNLPFNRYYKEIDQLSTLQKHILEVPANSDVLIAGLGFIKIVKASRIVVYTLPNVEVSVRKALI